VGKSDGYYPRDISRPAEPAVFVAEDLVEDHILHRLGLVSPGILQAAFEIQRVPVGPLVDRVAVDYGGTGGT